MTNKKHRKLIDATELIQQLSVDPVECPGCPEPEFLPELINVLEAAPAVNVYGMNGWCKNVDNEVTAKYGEWNKAVSKLRKLAIGDLISRQAAIDACHNYEDGKEAYAYGYVVEERLKRLPSAQPKSYREGYQAGFKDAQPERKTGKWIYNSTVTMKCNQCGLAIKDWDWHRFKYCPNCGADMREEDDE